MYLSENEKSMRRKKLRDAMAISSIDADEPSGFAKKLFNRYVEGELEYEEVTRLLIERHKAASDD